MGLLQNPGSMYRRWTENPLFKVQKTQLKLSGIILGLLKDHYSHNNVQFKYSTNPVESKILLDLHQQWNPTNCCNYPGAYVKRNNWVPRAETRVMGDHKEFLIEDDGKACEYWIPITADYSIIAVGKEYGEIELLLDDISIFFTVFWEPICTHLDFKRFDVTRVSEVGILQEEKDYRFGSVDLRMTFDFVWRLILEKPEIEKVKLETEYSVYKFK